MSTVEQQVKAIVAEQLGVKAEQVTNAASFVDDLGADSLDTVELVMALEEEFEIEIPDEDAEKITTVQQAIDYISERRNKSLIASGPAAAASASDFESFVSKRRVVITGLGSGLSGGQHRGRLLGCDSARRERHRPDHAL